MYFRWAVDKMWASVPAQAVVSEFLATFKEVPPSQESATFSIEQVLRQMQSSGNYK